jgi:hypothetical protein
MSNPGMSFGQRAAQGLERVTDICRSAARWLDHGRQEYYDIRLLQGPDLRQPARRVLEQRGQTGIVLAAG